MGVKFLGNKIKVRSQVYNNENGLIIKPNVHMHVRLNTHASVHIHLHTTHLFCSQATFSYRLNG